MLKWWYIDQDVPAAGFAFITRLSPTTAYLCHRSARSKVVADKPPHILVDCRAANLWSGRSDLRGRLQHIIRTRHCEKCNRDTRAELVRTLSNSGVSMVYWRCIPCKRPITTKPKYISHDLIRKENIDIEQLPIAISYVGTEVCAVCGEPGTEYHHFAPRYLFDDADRWPTAYLCKKHHKEWHDKVTPMMSAKRVNTSEGTWTHQPTK